MTFNLQTTWIYVSTHSQTEDAENGWGPDLLNHVLKIDLTFESHLYLPDQAEAAID